MRSIVRNSAPPISKKLPNASLLTQVSYARSPNESEGLWSHSLLSHFKGGIARKFRRMTTFETKAPCWWIDGSRLSKIRSSFPNHVQYMIIDKRRQKLTKRHLGTLNVNIIVIGRHTYFAPHSLEWRNRSFSLDWVVYSTLPRPFYCSLTLGLKEALPVKHLLDLHNKFLHWKSAEETRSSCKIILRGHRKVWSYRRG